jgi:hypothetical protein
MRYSVPISEAMDIVSLERNERSPATGGTAGGPAAWFGGPDREE